MSDSVDLSLAKKGEELIDWSGARMPVLEEIGKRLHRDKTLRGQTIGACLHLTAETAKLLIILTRGGAEVLACASNPLSTQDEVVAALAKRKKIEVYGIHGEDEATYYRHINQVLDGQPTLTMDDGADLVTALHQKRPELLPKVIGSSEETTTGVIRLRAMAKQGILQLPVIAVNDSDTKHLFDNRYGTGQSTIDGILRATNILLAGKIFVVSGYGWCGRGIAARAKGMGARVIITEVDPIKALEAVMDGFEVMPVSQAAKIGDIFVTSTGDKNVIGLEEIKKMKDGVLLANAGHFNVELDYDGLVKAASVRRKIRAGLVEEFSLQGKKISVIGEGRLVNLVAAEGHPPEVMDLSFANQALAMVYLVKNAKTKKQRLPNGVHRLPQELDQEVARLKLKVIGIKIDVLTPEQKKYLSGWEEGT